MSNEIEKRIMEALGRTPLSSGHNLDGFQIDLDHYLYVLDLFDDFSVVQTDNPRCLLLARGKVRDRQKSPEDVANVLEQVWLESLRYNDWEAHELEVSASQVTLTFVTTTGNQSHDLCVTGKAVINGW